MKSVVSEVKCVPDHERCHCDIEPAGFKVKGIVNNLQKSPPLLSTNKQTMLRSHLTIVATFSCLLSGAGAASLARHDLSEVSGE